MPKNCKILWGKHPDYCHGEWIKVSNDTSQAYIAKRQAQGFETMVLPRGKHPDGTKDE